MATVPLKGLISSLKGLIRPLKGSFSSELHGTGRQETFLTREPVGMVFRGITKNNERGL